MFLFKGSNLDFFSLTLSNFKNELIALETEDFSMFSECFLSCHNHWKKCFVNSLFNKNMYLCVSMCHCAHVCGYPGRIGEGAGSPGSGVISSCGFAQNRYWKLNSGLLQQCVLFIAEQSSRPYLYVFEHLVNTQELIPCLRTEREDWAVCECTVVWAHASVKKGCSTMVASRGIPLLWCLSLVTS